MQAIILNLLISTLKSILFSFLSKKVLKKVIFSLLEKVADWTDTDVDDAIVAMAKDNEEEIELPK